MRYPFSSRTRSISRRTRSTRARCTSLECLERRELLAILNFLPASSMSADVTTVSYGTGFTESNSSDSAQIQYSGVPFNTVRATAHSYGKVLHDSKIGPVGLVFDNTSGVHASSNGLPTFNSLALGVRNQTFDSFNGDPEKVLPVQHTFHSYTGSVPGGRTSIRIDPGLGEKNGEPVDINLRADASTLSSPLHVTGTYLASYLYNGPNGPVSGDLLAGDLHELKSHSSDTGLLTFRAVIGQTVQLSLELQGAYTWPGYDPKVTHSGGGGYEVGFGYSISSTSVKAFDIAATDLKWDTKNGGIDFTFEVRDSDVPKDTTIKFFWVKGEQKLGELTELRTALQAGKNLGVKGVYPSSRPNITTLPPSGATGLRMVIDDGNQVSEMDETNNLLTIDYAPTFEIKAKYDDDKSTTVIGRFFTDVVVTGQNAHFDLPESLAALLPTLKASVGTKNLTVTSTGGSSYVTSDFDPGILNQDTDLVIEFDKNASVFHTERAKVDVEPLPDWFKNTVTGKDIGFDPKSRRYLLKGSFLDVHTGNLIGFSLPGGTATGDIWLGAGATSGLDAKVAVEISTGLDRTVAPTVLGTIDVDLTFLGKSVYKKHLNSSTQSGPFVLSMDLNPGTLTLTGATLTYAEIGNEKADVLGGEFTKGFFKATSEVKAVLTHDLKLSLSLNGDGTIKSSNLKFHLDAELSGNLVKMQILSNPLARTILSRIVTVFKDVLNTTPPGIVLRLLQAALETFGLVPEFTMQAAVTGKIVLDGTAILMTDRSVQFGSFGGSFELALKPALFITWRGNTEEILGLPESPVSALKIYKFF